MEKEGPAPDVTGHQPKLTDTATCHQGTIVIPLNSGPMSIVSFWDVMRQERTRDSLALRVVPATPWKRECC